MNHQLLSLKTCTNLALSTQPAKEKDLTRPDSPVKVTKNVMYRLLQILLLSNPKSFLILR
jgi:hypothetical protein